MNWPSESVCTPDRAALTKEMSDSAARLKAYDRCHPAFFERVRNTVNVPDEYSSAMRIFGLYPLAAIPVTIAAQNANKKFRKWHQTSLEDLPVEGRLIVFGTGSRQRPYRQRFGAGFSALPDAMHSVCRIWMTRKFFRWPVRLHRLSPRMSSPLMTGSGKSSGKKTGWLSIRSGPVFTITQRIHS